MKHESSINMIISEFDRLSTGAPKQLMSEVERDFYRSWQQQRDGQLWLCDRLITEEILGKAFDIWGCKRSTIQWILTMEEDLWHEFIGCKSHSECVYHSYYPTYKNPMFAGVV